MLTLIEAGVMLAVEDIDGCRIRGVVVSVPPLASRLRGPGAPRIGPDAATVAAGHR
jgi:hypothetical protein